ncbi:hypothetical protein GCM10009555_063250 [Acrocarpospora macrocephala]
MSDQALDVSSVRDTPPEPQPDKTLPAIRQALSHPRDREGFGAGLPVAVEKARAAGDWREVEDFTQTWWYRCARSGSVRRSARRSRRAPRPRR